MNIPLSDRNSHWKEIEIVRKFADLGFQIQPKAIELLKGYESSRDFNIDELAKSVAKSLDSVPILVISSEHIREFIKKRGKSDKKIEEKSPSFQLQVHAQAPIILKSFSNYNRRNHEDFLPLFMDRYERIGGIIKKRINCDPIRSIKNGRSESGGEEISVVGMVSSINQTARGNVLVELEDPTGHLPVIFQHQEEIIADEIIGVTGYLSKSALLIADRIIYPDVPFSSSSTSQLPLFSGSNSNSNELKKKKPVYAVFISDLHVGSNTFLEDPWHRFVQWLKEKAKSINIAYLVVAGDIVDGIGVYPDQEGDLSIKNIEEQYKIAAEYFSEISSHIHIVIAPGNHDAVHLAEPQPPLPENFRKLFPSNAIFVSNPSYVNIGGRIVLIYHGQSFDNFVNDVPRLSYSKPEEVAVEMLRRRHVSPTYGKNVTIVPNTYDYGVIDNIPDIFHCGHVHTVGISKYRNVLLINSGTWQSQTSYQKKRDINPVPGCATLVELSEMKVKVMKFIAG